MEIFLCECLVGAYCGHAVLTEKIGVYRCPFGSCFKRESKVTRLSLENVDVSDVDFDEPVGGSPNVGGKWATFGLNQIVGNGSITNEKCGTFSTHYGCFVVICMRVLS